MVKGRHLAVGERYRVWQEVGLAMLLVFVMGGCELLRPEAKPATPPKPITEFPILPFEDAVVAAADELFGKSPAAFFGGTPEQPRALAIDPLIDGITGFQSTATRSMKSTIIDVLQAKYTHLAVQPFTTSTLARSPLVLIGTLTAIDGNGEPTGKQRHSYRIWLTLLDLSSGTIIAKARARARLDTVDPSPNALFRDSPAWGADPARDAYTRTCHAAKVGDAIPQDYLDSILAAALVSDATEAYDAGRYEEALNLYLSARALRGGDQLRVHNGIYLANEHLGRKEAALASFDNLVDFGLKHDRLAVKFLFKPGSTAFWSDPQVSGSYSLWLERIAARAARGPSCLEITGHASRTGPEPLNERLSLLRAGYIKRRLEAEEPPLSNRMVENGVGSQENLIGTGTDDAVDALDRRVEFRTFPC